MGLQLLSVLGEEYHQVDGAREIGGERAVINFGVRVSSQEGYKVSGQIDLEGILEMKGRVKG
jgi:hypothetical protein